MSYRAKLTLSFLLVILLTISVTLVIQRVIIEPTWTQFLTSFSLERRGPELASIVSQNIQRARRWVELRPLLEQLSTLYRVKVFLTDANGDLQVQSRYPEDIQPIQAEIDKALQGETSSTQITLSGGKNFDVVTSPVFVNNRLVGTIQIVQERTNLGRVFGFPLTSSLLIGGGIAAILSLFLVYLVSRQVTLPIRKMKQMAMKFSQGDFSARVDLKSKDELGELARVLNEMAGKLEETERIRRELLANISHELRTPLTTVQGYIEALIDGVLPEEKREESLKLVLEEVRKTERLVNSILELSRLEAGAIKMDIRAFDLKGLVLKIKDKLSLSFERKNLKLEVSAPGEEALAFGDPDRIGEVVEILLDNSLRYTEPGGHVKISLVREGDQVLFKVEDTGIGISPEELPRIFNRFYRSTNIPKGERLGAGLGLAIAKEIIEAHGSQIMAESVPGKGSSFSFYLKAGNR
ncbi:MAG: cell wall metabolism sensor histidine kinase WalK [Caldiserica bacterium]|jgi:signal transduction histidine kinase|nr:cell wall metabolism sensor histidine kinase WalK [Caldisericota bacterium]MDH7562715.1 ATP-binding protein [Caldisericota bacterium]